MSCLLCGDGRCQARQQQVFVRMRASGTLGNHPWERTVVQDSGKQNAVP